MKEIKDFIFRLKDLGVNITLQNEDIKIVAPKNVINSHIVLEIKKLKIDIINYLKKKSEDDLYESYTLLKPALLKDYYSLSHAQKRLYILQQMELDSIAYNMPNFISLEIKADKTKIEEIFSKLISRHESFRTSFEIIGEEPVQFIHKYVDFKIKNVTIDKSEKQAIQNSFIQAFDLSQAPLLRVAIVDIKGENSLLFIDMHHIISDGVSFSILEREFKTLLSGEELSPLRLQYKDFSEWQNSKEQQEFIKDQEQYWLNKFEEEIPVLNLPIDYARPLVQSQEGAKVYFTLSKEETEGIKSFTKKNDLTLYMSLLSVFNILLSKLSGQDDIIVGTPIAGRNHADLEQIVGVFVNTLSIRCEVKGEETIRDFVSSLKQTVLGAYKNQNYQFDDLVDKVSVERDTSRNPIFDVMFNLLNQRDYSGDLVEESLNIHKKTTSKFDLNLKAIDFGDQIFLIFEYNTRLFSENSIDRIICNFENVVKNINKGDEKLKIKEIEIISEKEKQAKLTYFNEKLEYRIRNNTVQGRLNESYNEFKDKIAIEIGDKYISYSELDARKRVVSNWIAGNAIKKESLVGILVDDRAQVIISILGILDSSCIFVPIDINLPANRIKGMIESIGINYFVTCDKGLLKLNKTLPEIKRENVFVYGKAVDIIDIDFYEDRSLCTDAVYIYFTSGSTGKPKPIAGKNESLVQFIDWEIDRFKVDNSFRVSQLINIGFDVYLRDIFLPLLSGGTICIPLDNNIVLDGFQLTHWINRKQITLVHCVPSVFNIFSNEYIENSFYMGLKYVLMSGEQILPSNLIKWYSVFGNRIQLVNLYGPTETTLARTCYFIQPDDINRNRLTIGQAIVGSRIIILDKDKNICEVGTSGELYIRTAYSSLGYYMDSQLTREKFVDNPFKKDDNILLYRSGDVAIENSNGEIEITGRIDHQVKIRGFRIELGEIESVLLKHENINETVVLALEENNDKYLCAYVVCKEDLNHEELRSYISLQLPDYMVPTYFVELDSIPLNSNGKVNRKALASPEVKAGDDYVAPSNATEEKLVEIWSKVLNINNEDISVNANFFSIGGHSLKATVLSSKIHKETGVEFPLRDIFRYSTIKDQAKQIELHDIKEFVSIPIAKELPNYLLSSAQKRMYLLQQMDLYSIAYNMPYVFSLGTDVDKVKIEDVFQKLITRHESFRTSFEFVGDEIVQVINKFVGFKIVKYSIEKSEVDNIRDQFIRPFDLSTAPLLRVAIVNIKGADSLLMIDMHHIISDGVSQTILKQDFQSLYSSEELPALRLQYKDFSEWQNSDEQQQNKKEQEEYWIKRFEGEIPVLDLPSDYVRPPIQSFEGASVSFILNNQETKIIKAISDQIGTTLYMAILSIYNILLSKLSGQEDVIVGTPIAARRHIELENIVGMFVNTLAIRNHPKEEKTFKQFLQEVKQSTLEAYENQEYQFENLVEKIDLIRDTSRNPIFNVVLNLLNHTEYKGDLYHAEEDKYVHVKGSSKFDLILTVIDFGDQFLCRFEYCTKLFKKETIERFITYFKQLINQLSENTEKRIYEIEIITELEKKQILYEFNNTKTKYTKDITIHELFEKQVEKTPNNLAIISNNRNISYIELNNQANKLASILRKLGVKPSSLVCIIIDRSIEMIIGTMGILKSGGAYIPIEPSLPELRIRRLLKELNVKIIITSSLWLKKLDEITNKIPGIDHIISLDEPDNQEIQKFSTNKKFLSNNDFKNNSSANLKQQSKPEDIAYIIFTSGSTGLPKGVVEQHKPVVNVIEWINKEFSVTENDKLLFIASLGFDLSVYDIFGTLSSGATIHLLSSEEIKDPNYIVDIVLNEGITIWDSAPAALQQLVPLFPEKNKNNKLRLVLLSGDWIPLTLPPILKETFEGVNVISLGGATEATIWSNYFPIGEINPNWNSIPYGKPIQNAKYYILNNKLKICPIGVTGDLYIGGKCLSLGYINDPELSSNKFISNPFIAGEKMYKTGDLARLMPDLNIEFLGRIDNQVKIRGFRIELGEIENCLLKHELIKGTVVIARTNKIGDKYLCAYLVLKNHEYVNMTIKDLKLQEYLAESLPDYMIPAHFVEIEKIPLTSNGKIDKKELPEPEIKSGENYFAPSNKTEEKLIEICSEVLEIKKEQIDINASFFDIGGNSLNAVKIVGKLIHDFEVNIADIFKYDTLAELASNISYKKGYLIEKIEELKKSAKYEILDIVRDNLLKEKQEYEKTFKKEKLVGINKRVKYQNILVTGATGYLGAHIVYDLLKITKSTIYLIVRGESIADAEIRLKSKLSFYFGEKIVEKYKGRLVVIKGDLRENIFGIEVEKYQLLSKIIDTIIHSSANVRHYGKYEEFYKDNVVSTERLLEFALNDKKKSFHYISTTAVKDGNIKNKKYSLYTEYYKDEDQQSNNLYVLTKQEAERKVLAYRKKGLNGSIYRVGNLSFHSSTGKFQENINENAFYSRIKEFMQLGHLPSEVISDISFIDYVSKAIVLLLTRKHLSNEIYHIYNSEFALTLDELSEVFNNVGLKIKFVNYEQFLDYLLTSLDNIELRPLVESFIVNSISSKEKKNKTNSLLVSDRTQYILKKLGFKWVKVNSKHIQKMLEHCKEVEFL